MWDKPFESVGKLRDCAATIVGIRNRKYPGKPNGGWWVTDFLARGWMIERQRRIDARQECIMLRAELIHHTDGEIKEFFRNRKFDWE